MLIETRLLHNGIERFSGCAIEITGYDHMTVLRKTVSYEIKDSLGLV